MQKVQVVANHLDRATVRVGDVFLKMDADQARADAEIEAMELAPIPTPEILWRRPPVLALAEVPGRALGRLEEPSSASPAAWSAVGAAVRMLHDAPLPPRPGRSVDELAAELARECDWLISSGVVPAADVTWHRRRAEEALRPWSPVFVHGDLQICHVFMDGDTVTGIVDWSEGAQGDALFDIAILTLCQENRLDHLLAGYGRHVDRKVIRGWWSYRCLTAIRWLADNGYGAPETFPEFQLLTSRS